MQKGNIFIYLLLIGLILAGLAGGYYLGTKKTTSSQIPQNSTYPSSTVSPVPTATSAPIPSPTPDETASWKTFSNGSVSFKYPQDWTVNTTDYLNSIMLETPNKTVGFTLSEGQYPFGFGGPGNFTSEDLTLEVAGKQYQVKETTVNNSAIFINLPLNTPKNHHILLGTGYPGAISGKASLTDYENSKKTIFKILTTIKFL